MTKKQFRILLSAYLFLTFFGAFFDDIFTSALLESIFQAKSTLNSGVSGLHYAVVLILASAVGIGAIASFVGLFIFRPWAPKLSLISTALALCLWSLIGVHVASGWSTAFTGLSDTLWGVILTMMYFTPLRKKFRAI